MEKESRRWRKKSPPPYAYVYVTALLKKQLAQITCACMDYDEELLELHSC
jgi:hypothetical protein